MHLQGFHCVNTPSITSVDRCETDGTGIAYQKLERPTLVLYGAQWKTRRGEITMMYLETPPKVIATTIFTAMPDHFRRKGTSRQWNHEWKPGNE
jgi:hypothetical protein